MNKYRNQKVKVGDIIFDSKKEAKRYGELLLMQRAKLISELYLQPKFILQESFKDNKGKKHIAINYIADFQYIQDGQIVVEDVKGHKTDVYNLKKKLFLARYPFVRFDEI
jgi:hypothetical protein